MRLTTTASEPIHIISLGAGVQSSTMALMAAHGEITPMPKCAIFADTQREPDSVYECLERLSGALPFPIHIESAGNLADESLKVRRGKKSNQNYVKHSIPAFILNADGSHGQAFRQCTMDFKIAVIRKKALSLSDNIILWMGVSLDEVHRMKQSVVSGIVNHYPLIDRRMTRNDFEQWLKRHNYSASRSACDMCPYHSDNEWRRLRDKEPKAFANAVQYERDLQKSYAQVPRLTGIPFLHASRIPLDQVDFSTDEDHGQQVMFGNECEGMCGV